MDVILTVNSVTAHSTSNLDTTFNPKNGVFAVANVTMKVKSGSYDYDELDWSYQVPDGNTYAAGDGNGDYAGYDPSIDSGTLPAGGLKRGNIAFDVSTVHGGKVIISDADGTELGYWTVP